MNSVPKLIVVVDTEEEFDWAADPDPNAKSVSAINKLHLVQEIFDEYGIAPCYVVDYPIASSKESVDVLKPILERGGCEIGAHLHPWVNPPFGESLTRANMYPGNLSRDLEYEKLDQLTDTITSAFGVCSNEL